MQVLLTSDARFERTPDGTIWGHATYGRDLWSRYLDVFSSVLMAARVADVEQPSDGLVKSSLARIQFWPLMIYSGLAGFVRALPNLRSSVAAAVRHSDAVIVRAPSALAYLVARAAATDGRPFGVEIVGDPDQFFAPGAFRHPLRGVIRRVAAEGQRRLSRDAMAVLYVTTDALQRRYPTAGQSYAASDVALNDQAFGGEDRPEWSPPAAFVLVTVAALDQPYKGITVLLDAIGILRRVHAPVRLRIVGGGRLMPRLRRQCESLGISTEVEFLGQQDVAGVRDALDSADLFVLPSLSEGLPRALLEAMARGLPAVASNVGGVAELLPAECLVSPGNAHALAARIARLIEDPLARRQLGARNLAHARRYHEHRLAATRREFLETVKRASGQAEAEVQCA